MVSVSCHDKVVFFLEKGRRHTPIHLTYVPRCGAVLGHTTRMPYAKSRNIGAGFHVVLKDMPSS